ncbi:hypothetical protein [Dongia sp.]|uniref:hypothetical protein n=1 Tax=Dongia sp. TaxID=1977262 RepID=UPI0035B0634C
MIKSKLWDALHPLASRMPKLVKEHEVLRIALSIEGKDPIQGANLARQEVLKWAQKRCGGKLPAEAWELQEFEYFSGGRNSVGVRIENEASDIWAIRADDPDKTVAGRIWTTEVVVGLMGDQSPRFSARLLASTAEEALNVEPHTPGFVQQVAEKCGLTSGNTHIEAVPWLIDSESEADDLIALLLDPGRRVPVFVLTVPETSTTSAPLIDASMLARATLGIA